MESSVQVHTQELVKLSSSANRFDELHHYCKGLSDLTLLRLHTRYEKQALFEKAKVHEGIYHLLEDLIHGVCLTRNLL